MYLAEKCGGGVNFLKMFGDPVGQMIKAVAKLAMRAAFGIFEAVGKVGTTDEATSNVINRQTQWIVVYLAIGSILFAAIKMALDRRAEPAQTALKGILRVILVSAAGSTVIGAFVTLMDSYSNHLFKNSLDNLLVGIDCNNQIPDMLLLVIGFLLIISAIIHAILMWVRLGVMIILVGTLPMAAAASMTDWGGTWWRKHFAWMIAWLLYKPTVSLVLYSGAVMIRASEGAQKNHINVQIAGMATLLLSAIALPALMRIIVPATAALGGDSVGDATMGVAGGIASGAKSLADSSGRKGDSAPSGSQGPSGANGYGGQGGEGRAGSSGGSGSAGAAGTAGAAGSGAGKAAAAGNPALAAMEVAAKVAKGAANVAKSGIEGANRDDGR